MKILINDNKIDFTLESEKVLGDVIKDIEKWISKNDNVIRTVKVNNRYFDLNNVEEGNNLKIEDIELVEIETSNKLELAFENLGTINEYTNFITEVLDNDKEAIIDKNDEILEALDLIQESLKLSLKVLNINPSVILNQKGEKLESTLSVLADVGDGYRRRYLDGKAIEKIKHIMDDVSQYIIKIYKWGVVKNYKKIVNTSIDDIPFFDEILADLLLVCRNTSKKFEEIGTDILVGDDLKAFNSIYDLSGLLSEIIEVFMVIKTKSTLYEEVNSRDLFIEITEKLKEIEKSFQNNDLVSIADIMEYELKPLFEDLIQLIDKIREIFKVK